MTARSTSATAGSDPNVAAIHSSRITVADSAGSQASRPKPNRFACASVCPVQFRSAPMLDTAHTPDSGRPFARPEAMVATVAWSSARISKSSTWRHWGTR